MPCFLHLQAHIAGRQLTKSTASSLVEVHLDLALGHQGSDLVQALAGRAILHDAAGRSTEERRRVTRMG